MTITVNGAPIDYSGLPEGLRDGMRHYIEQRIKPGGFLSAMLRNDLRDASKRADDENRYRLFDIVSWLYNEAPGACWGSPENFQEWLRGHP